MLNLLHPYLDTIIQALAATAAGYLVMILHTGLQKMGINLDAAKQARLEAAAKQAIATVAEESAQKALNGITSAPNSKLSRAVDIVNTLVDKVPPAQVESLIHALLPSMGEGAQVKALTAPPGSASPKA